MEDSLKFYIVSTPIGNLADMTFRAVDVLKKVDVILCEDTRVTRKLCDHYEISTSRESYHAHSNDSKEDSILRRCQEGTTFALVSDAGTPTISDPGVKIVSRLIHSDTDIEIIPIPGATALIAALSATGFSGNDFRFFGFIPHKKGRTSFFEQIAAHLSVAICYESSHRIMKTLETLSTHSDFQNRTICVAREITKMFEQKIIGTAAEIYEYFVNHPGKIKGEFVIVFDKK